MKRAKGLNVTMNKGLITGVLYQTKIISVDCHKKSLTLRSGGWYTMHTKKCINRILDYYEINVKVFQEKGDWFVFQNETKIPFQNGMQIKFNYSYENVS